MVAEGVEKDGVLTVEDDYLVKAGCYRLQVSRVSHVRACIGSCHRGVQNPLEIESSVESSSGVEVVRLLPTGIMV